MTEIPERVGFLKKIHLFHGMTEPELLSIAAKLRDYSANEGEVIVQQDSKADAFYFIRKGKVKITRRVNNKDKTLATLVSNDYFGEMALISNRRRSATVTALETTSLLILARKDFEELYKRNPKLKPTFDVTIRSRLLARRLQFNWIRSDEVIYFLARKHPIMMVRALLLPVLLTSVPILLLVLESTVLQSIALLVAAALAFLIIGAWIAWVVIDWGNDYYIVTNQRVVWVEKVVGLYDSRMESPLGTILSVGVETDQLGRIFDYGNVIVRTFVGKIPFNHVIHPTQAARMIEEYWGRTKEFASGAEKEAMKDAIRKRLGLPIPPKPTTAPVPAAPAHRVSRLARFIGENRLKLHYEEGEIAIYRKHWFVLLKQTGISILGVIAGLVLEIWRLYTLAGSVEHALIQRLPDGSFSIDVFGVALPGVLLVFLGWFIYEFIDWSNDIFQVTNEQIIDIDKKPFGTEQRRSAPLENILGTEYEKVGILGNIFNYGTVTITVGGTKLAFEDVIYPAMVQSDIDRRRMARAAKKREAELQGERERMAEWLAMYHTNSEAFRKEQEQQKKTKSE